MTASLLTKKLISVRGREGAGQADIAELLALLASDDVVALPALRPHQRYPLHCFLAQVGAMALLAGGEHEPPQDAGLWRELLRSLTPGFPGGEPWSLVVDDLAKPAFLQPPVPEGSWEALRKVETTPDALDMLVTAKNHDLKAARLHRADSEHWFFALLTLQTWEGFLGSGNYGISRMNGGFASRPFVGPAPAGGSWGASRERHASARCPAPATGRGRPAARCQRRNWPRLARALGRNELDRAGAAGPLLRRDLPPRPAAT